MTEQEAQEEEPLRMSAYYYSFEPTGVIEIDRILSAVARAGKAYHHTEQWDEDAYGAGSPVNWIQAAANEAAARLSQRVVVAAPSDTDHQPNHLVRRRDQSTPCWCPATADHTVADTIPAQPVQVEVTEDVRPLGELRESGLLWLVNRQVFHPLGFALALVVEDGRVLGWKLLGDGVDPWNFEDGTEAEHLARVRALLRPAALGGDE